MNYATYQIISDVDLSNNGLDGYTYFFVDASNNNIDIIMTTNYVANGLSHYFLRTDNSSNAVTLSAPGGYTINGTNTISLNTNQACEVIFNNNNWIAPRYLYN